MAAQVFNDDTIFVFGTAGLVTEVVVKSFSEDDTFNVSTTVENEDGITVERRYDDRTKDASMTISYRTNYTKPTQGSTLTYDGTTYIIESIGGTRTQGQVAEMTLNLKSSEGITLP